MASELFKGLNRNHSGCFIRKREPTSDTGVEVLKAQINAGTIRPWSSTTAPFSPLSSLCFSSWCCLGMLQLQLLPPSVTHPFHTQYQKRVKTSKLLFYISKSHWNQVQWFKMSCNCIQFWGEFLPTPPINSVQKSPLDFGQLCPEKSSNLPFCMLKR